MCSYLWRTYQSLSRYKNKLTVAAEFELLFLLHTVGFYPYGTEQEDESYDFDPNTPVSQLQLDPPMIFYNYNLTDVYVSSCEYSLQTAQLILTAEHYWISPLQISSLGVISFGAPFTLTRLMSLDADFSELYPHPVIAPLWSLFSSSVVYSRVTQNSTILQQISEDVEDMNSLLPGYKPVYALVITWVNATTSTGLNVRTCGAFS